MKICSICQRRRQRRSFNADSTKSCGLQSICRECQRGNYRRGDNAAKAAERRIRYRLQNPQARRAHRKIENELKRGRLQPEPCQCGSDAKTEAHHHLGYEHPFDIVWVCRSCHVRMEPRRGAVAS